VDWLFTFPYQSVLDECIGDLAQSENALSGFHHAQASKR
jgi:hypothetical protein